MKRMLMRLCVGTVIFLNCMMQAYASEPAQDAALQALLSELGLCRVSEANITKEQEQIKSLFHKYAMARIACGAFLASLSAYSIYKWYANLPTLSERERLGAVEAEVKDLKHIVQKLPKAAEGDAPTNLLSSTVSLGKYTISGLAGYLLSNLTTSLGTLAVTTLISKSEPTYQLFLYVHTGFRPQVEVLRIYHSQQSADEAFCLETARLVNDIEKILGYVDYQIAKIKKGSLAVKALLKRREALIAMTNTLVECVARKQYDKMVLQLELIENFVAVGLMAGIVV